MKTLELKGHLLTLIANTNDKIVLQKLYVYLTTPNSSKTNEDNDIAFSPQIKATLDKRVKEYKKNPDSACSLDLLLNQLD
jgi:hypothetical protein